MCGVFPSVTNFKLSCRLNVFCIQGDLNNECVGFSPMSPTNGPFKTIFQAKLSYQLDRLSPGRPEQWMCAVFPSVTVGWPFQGHLLSKSIILTHQALSPGTPKNEQAESSPVSPINCLFKTISPVKLSYWCNDLCLQGDQTKQCAQSSPVSPMNSPFKTFSSKTMVMTSSVPWEIWTKDMQRRVFPGFTNK